MRFCRKTALRARSGTSTKRSPTQGDVSPTLNTFEATSTPTVEAILVPTTNAASSTTESTSPGNLVTTILTEATTPTTIELETISTTTIHLEMVEPTSDDFTKYKELMGLNLQKLYKIEHNDNKLGNVSDYE